MPRIKRQSVTPDTRTNADKVEANDKRPAIVEHVKEKITRPRDAARKTEDKRKMIAVSPEVHAEISRISKESRASIPAIVKLMLEDFKRKF